MDSLGGGFFVVSGINDSQKFILHKMVYETMNGITMGKPCSITACSTVLLLPYLSHHCYWCFSCRGGYLVFNQIKHVLIIQEPYQMKWAKASCTAQCEVSYYHWAENNKTHLIWQLLGKICKISGRNIWVISQHISIKPCFYQEYIIL